MAPRVVRKSTTADPDVQRHACFPDPAGFDLGVVGSGPTLDLLTRKEILQAARCGSEYAIRRAVDPLRVVRFGVFEPRQDTDRRLMTVDGQSRDFVSRSSR